MIIASCDIETTGLDPSFCQALEVGVVLWDTTDLDTPVRELPAFHCYVVHDRIQGEPYGLGLNQRILQRIARQEPGYQYLRPNLVGHALFTWLQAQPAAAGCLKNGRWSPARITPTGFNFDSFDRQFLTRLEDFNDWVQFKHRSLSPATLFYDPSDVDVPGSDKVFARAGVTVRPEDRHTALGDARGAIEVLRAAFRRGKGPGPGSGAFPVPQPRCPDCGDRQSVRVPTDHGEWDDVPCGSCNPHDILGFPMGESSIAGQLAIAG